ncbi:hypothetical protein R1flu_011348 [Riccia fluitans]|uniref:C3H1-type domain-containing protein n=1 Tax=Riccia fluitans TaxID=41844 RepID=A0ABD1Z7J1_9MARC
MGCPGIWGEKGGLMEEVLLEHSYEAREFERALVAVIERKAEEREGLLTKSNMGDVNVCSGDGHMSIETLRKLALLSMPKRQGRNYTFSNPPSKSEGPTVFSSPAAKPPEDKEEGELSSDDDAEGATATLASAGPSSIQSKAPLKLIITSQGSAEEMLAPGANLTGSNSNEGLSTASVAEAFLASLRIPVPKPSRASAGEEAKEDDFVIKFDEDSEDSDGEHQQLLTSSSGKLDSNSEKLVLRSLSLPSRAVPSHAGAAVPNQNPAELKSEIDRVKKQIALMERTKVKQPAAPVIPKSTRVVCPDTRPSVTAAPEPRSVVQRSTGNVRSVPDLESLRLQIAAKESELQNRRQRLLVKGPEGSLVGGDGKGIGVVVPTTNPSQSTKINKESSLLPGPHATTVVSISAEKTTTPVRKETSNQTEGLIALASIGPSGVCLPKKDARHSEEDSRVDVQTSSEDLTKLQSSSTKTGPSNVVGKLLVSRNTKRPHGVGDSADKRKVARIDASPPEHDNLCKVDMAKEVVSLDSAAVRVNGSSQTLTVHTGSQSKRKVDVETFSNACTEAPGPASHVGRERMKKLKLAMNSAPGGTPPLEKLMDQPKASGLIQAPLAPVPTPSTEQIQLQSDNTNAVNTSSDVRIVETAPAEDVTVSYAAGKGEAGVRIQTAARTVEEASPGESVVEANIPPRMPTISNGSAEISIDEGEYGSKIRKPRFQNEESHALPALAGVSVPQSSPTVPVIVESSGNRRELVLSNEHSGGDDAKTHMGFRQVLFPAEVQSEKTSGKAEIWDDDPDAEMLEQLQREEELLDKELEDAQEERHRCEHRERAARKEHREAQRALRVISTQCELLHQRREFLLSRIHQAEGIHYSKKLAMARKSQLTSSAGRPSLRSTGFELASPSIPTGPAKSADHWALSLPLSEPFRGPGSYGVDGAKMVKTKFESSLEGRGKPLAFSETGATSVVQALRKEFLPAGGSISGVAPLLINVSQSPVVHGVGTVTKKVSAPALHAEFADLPSATPAEAVTTSSRAPSRKLEQTATTLLETGGHDAPKGFKVPQSVLGPVATELNIGPERKIVARKQVADRSDGSLPTRGHSDQQGRNLLPGSIVSDGNLSPSVIAQEYVPTSKVGTSVAGSAQVEKAAFTKPGSRALTVEVPAEDMTELSRDQRFMSVDKRNRGADGENAASSRRSMAGINEDKSMQGELVGKPTAREPVLVVYSSADVPLRKDLLLERPHNIQTPKGQISREYGSSLIAGKTTNTQVSMVTSSIEDTTSGAQGFKDSFGGDSLGRTGKEPGVPSCGVDGTRSGDPDADILLVKDVLVGRSPVAGLLGKQEVDHSGNLAMDYRGLSSDDISLNRVEEPEDTGINLSSKDTRGGCQVLSKAPDFVSPRALSDADKIGPATLNSGSSIPIHVETGTGFREGSAKDLSACSDRVREPEHNRPITVKISTHRESVYQSTGSAGGFGDMDMLELVEIPENLDSVESKEYSCISEPGPSDELQGQKPVRYSDSSTDRNSLPVVEAVPEPEGQHPMRLSKNDNGRSEVPPVNDMPNTRPTESCPLGPNPKHIHHPTVALEHKTLAMLKVQTQKTGVDKEDIVPQLQHHLLGQLLDKVEVGTQGTVVHEEVVAKGTSITTLENDDLVEARSAQLEYSGGVVHRRVRLQVPVREKAEVDSKIRNKGYSRESSVSEAGVPSAVGFTSLGCFRELGISGTRSVITTERRAKSLLDVEDEECVASFGSPFICPKYESPLAVFRAYRSLPQFAGAMHLSSDSKTWSHAVNPLKPLCRFEHRGQCRNEHCPWQHADDYALSTPMSLGMQKKEYQKNLYSDGKTNDTGGIPQQAGSLVRTSPGSIPGQLETFYSLVSSNGFSPSRLLYDYDVTVPIYRIGYITLKAEDPNNMRFLGIPHKVENKTYNSFLLSPSTHRTLPSESPCLIDTSGPKLSTVESGDAAQIPLWRYSEHMQEERVLHESGSLHASKDVEMWLELALNLIDFDLSTDKQKARDEALCILSRGLETRQNSVTLWMAYSCLFRTRGDNPGNDDMFQFAIQYNPGSYELWHLYINSRRDLPSRLDACERAVVALAENKTGMDVDSSACLLDISLQMLYSMCVSGSTQESLAWVDDLIHDTADDGNRRRGSTSALLSHLTKHDACILWVTCAYLSASGEIPLVIIKRLGCKQDLLYTLDWGVRASFEKIASVRTMRTLSTAASSRRGCLSLEDLHSPTSNRNDHSRVSLGVNYVQCLAVYEGLQSAGRLSQRLTELYPNSVELILLHARIEERRGGIDKGLHVFETAISRWPAGQPGLLRLWNQYAVHGLVWAGKSSAHEVLSRSVVSLVKPSSNQLQEQLSSPQMRTAAVTSAENAGPYIWNDIKEHYVTLVNLSSGRSDESGPVQSWHEEDMVYGLISLALVEALSGDQICAQSTISRAMKIAVSQRDLQQCLKELASLQLSGAVVEERVLCLLDRCKMDYYNFSHVKPLSLRVLEDLKRPQVRKFFVDLLGLWPVEHSLMNTVLEICYGPSLLPLESLTPKDVFRFAEGILEAAPGNVEVALSLSRLVFSESWFVRSKSLSHRICATALLISSLQQSWPIAPEVHWVEAGLLLKQLSKGKPLEEYYLHALVKYPLSAALKQGLAEARLHVQDDKDHGILRPATSCNSQTDPGLSQVTLLSYKVGPRTSHCFESLAGEAGHCIFEFEQANVYKGLG